MCRSASSTVPVGVSLGRVRILRCRGFAFRVGGLRVYSFRLFSMALLPAAAKDDPFLKVPIAEIKV